MSYVKLGRSAFVLSLLGLAVISTMLFAKHYRVSTVDRFQGLLQRHELAVVLFYDEQTGRDYKRMFDEVSDEKRYDDAEILFMRATLSRDEMINFAKEFQVSSTPAFLLFEKGKIVKDANGKTVMLTGSVSKRSLRSFIEGNFGRQIDDILEEQKEAEGRDDSQSRGYYRRRPHFSVDYGYGYPYYGGFGYPYGRPYYWGRRGYYRHGYRPYGGRVGFGIHF